MGWHTNLWQDTAVRPDQQRAAFHFNQLCLSKNRAGSTGAQPHRRPVEGTGKRTGGRSTECCRSKPQNSKRGLKYPSLLCNKSLCSRKGPAITRHSKQRQALWKHGHLAPKHGMKYGTSEADNSPNNYLPPHVLLQQ